MIEHIKKNCINISVKEIAKIIVNHTIKTRCFKQWVFVIIFETSSSYPVILQIIVLIHLMWLQVTH